MITSYLLYEIPIVLYFFTMYFVYFGVIYGDCYIRKYLFKYGLYSSIYLKLNSKFKKLAIEYKKSKN